MESQKKDLLKTIENEINDTIKEASHHVSNDSPENHGALNVDNIHGDENYLSLAKRDKYLKKLEEEIVLKKNFLENKRKDLEKISYENEFLENVKKDYEKYYKYIIQEKKEQLEKMAYLDEYIKDIMEKNKLTDDEIENSKKEQRDLLNEMKNIKTKMDNLMIDKHL